MKYQLINLIRVPQSMDTCLRNKLNKNYNYKIAGKIREFDSATCELVFIYDKIRECYVREREN